MNANIAMMILSGLIFLGSIINYITSNQIVKTRTEIITVHLDKNNIVTRAYKDGTWDDTTKWLRTDKGKI